MSKSTRRVLIYGGALILVVSGLFAMGRLGSTNKGPDNQGAIISQAFLGKPAPDFTLADLEGNTYTLREFQDKNPVLLEFFAVWCPHCQNQAPTTSQIAENNKEKGLIVLHVNSSPYGRLYSYGNFGSVTENDLKWYRDKFNVNEPLLFDQGEISQRYGIRGTPSFALINKDGNLVWQHSGEASIAALQTAIDKVLE